MNRSPEGKGIEFSDPGYVIPIGSGEQYNDIDFADLILQVVHLSEDSGETLIPVGEEIPGPGSDYQDPIMESTRQALLDFVNEEQPVGFINDTEVPAIIGMCRNALAKKLESDANMTENNFSGLPSGPLRTLIDMLGDYERPNKSTQKTR